MNMSKLIAIGEALIDFIPQETGKAIRHVNAFEPKVGGAPANVCGVFAKMGQQSQMITQLGNDPFGDKILETFEHYGIGCDYIKRTDEANTSLAFVSLQENGDREFSFYRNPGADMLMDANDIHPQWFEDADVLHFCSVSLGDFPMKSAHKKAIEYARQSGCTISFDPNLRFPLWKDKEQLLRAVKEFMPLAHILKISDEELEFLTGHKDINRAKEELLQGNTELVIYTEGSKGAQAFTRFASAQAPGQSQGAVDTTGAGDAFIGSFLYQLTRDGIVHSDLSGLTPAMLERYLTFSNSYCAKSVMRHGAIESYPDRKKMEKQR